MHTHTTHTHTTQSHKHTHTTHTEHTDAHALTRIRTHARTHTSGGKAAAAVCVSAGLGDAADVAARVAAVQALLPETNALAVCCAEPEVRARAGMHTHTHNTHTHTH